MGPAACHAGCDAVTRLDVRRPALRHTLVRQPAPARRAGLTWPRLPAAAEVAITGAGYLAYALVRLAVRAGRHAAQPGPGPEETRPDDRPCESGLEPLAGAQ